MSTAEDTNTSLSYSHTDQDGKTRFEKVTLIGALTAAECNEIIDAFAAHGGILPEYFDFPNARNEEDEELKDPKHYLFMVTPVSVAESGEDISARELLSMVRRLSWSEVDEMAENIKREANGAGHPAP